MVAILICIILRNTAGDRDPRHGVLAWLRSFSHATKKFDATSDAQDNEKKQKREPKETPEELQDCEMVFADF